MEMKLFLMWLAVALVMLIGWWRTFEKAAAPGWVCLVPIYNLQVLLAMAGYPGWYVVLLVLPPVNIFFALVMWIDFARYFGKGTLYAVGLWFPLTHPVFMLALGLGDAEYEGFS